MNQMRLTLIVIILSGWSVWSCTQQSPEPPQQEIVISDSIFTEELIPEPKPDPYGINLVNFEVDQQRVRRGDTFTRLLERQGLSRNDAHNLSRQIHPDFNVRRINAGRNIRFYHTHSAPSRQLQHIVYRHDQLNYTHIELIGDSVAVKRNRREPETNLRYAEGRITGSLYETLRSQGHSAKLVATLSGIFAWQIDFHRIRHGDHFRLIYEDHILDDRSIGIGNIKVAQFTHRNDHYFAFHYEEEGEEDYFDEHGNSLRRSYMRAPLRYSRITSHFTDNRYHPVLGRNMAHHGVDYAAPSGTPVYAVGDGTITRAHYDRNNGNFVRIRHNSVHETGYLHLNRIASGITPGANVEQGELIGYVGSTGLATGPHVCYRFWENGDPIDPLDVEADPVEPLAEEYLDDYEGHIFSLMHLLEQLPENQPHGLEASITVPGNQTIQTDFAGDVGSGLSR